MSWKIIKSPSQDLLDKTMLDAIQGSTRKCHDCGVSPGNQHLTGCDVARYLSCGGQRLVCDCDDSGDGDIWTGLWPGYIECYEYGLLCYWEGSNVFGEENVAQFDLNTEAELRLCKSSSFPEKVYSFKDFLKKFNLKNIYYLTRETNEKN